jgi:hypothetical protein
MYNLRGYMDYGNFEKLVIRVEVIIKLSKEASY